LSHDLSAVVAQFPLGDLPSHTTSVAHRATKSVSAALERIPPATKHAPNAHASGYGSPPSASAKSALGAGRSAPVTASAWVQHVERPRGHEMHRGSPA
jgi:hypothetical protein